MPSVSDANAPSLFAEESAARQALRAIFDAGVRAVAPDAALKRHLHFDGRRLAVGNFGVDLQGGKRDGAGGNAGRLLVVGAGKGAAPMAHAVEELLGERIHQGRVIVKYDHGMPLRRIALTEAAHPVPDAAGMAAAREVLALARSATARDVVLCLLTGGASALTPALCPGMALEDLRATTSLLLECGASIHEINAVRKHLSVFSGGQLARAASPAPVLSLIVSDVVGDDLDVIASGPTVPDNSTFTLCRDIARRYGIWERLPAVVRQRLHEGAEGRLPETPKADDAVFSRVHNCLVATLDQALDAAAAEARRRGFDARVLTSSLTGEARDKAHELASWALTEAEKLTPEDRPVCLLAGGETTVRLRGKGRGGRNQEMALAACLALHGQSRVCGLFAGTDGSDGPTDAAGGFAHGAVSGESLHSARAHLEDNDSYHWLDSHGLLLKTGPTRTNVMDMSVLLLMPPQR